jgi:hypothetical protein
MRNTENVLQKLRTDDFGTHVFSILGSETGGKPARDDVDQDLRKC